MSWEASMGNKPEKNQTQKPKKEKKPIYKCWWVYVIGVIVVCIVGKFALSLIDGIFHGYEELDVNGMVISEACDTLKKQGWQIDKVSGYYGKDTDCHNTKYVVEDTEYNRSKKTVEIEYTLPKFDEESVIGLPVNEVCKKLREADWETIETRQDIDGNYKVYSSCNGEEIVNRISFSGLKATIYLDKKSATSSSSSTTTTPSSSSSNSSSSSSTNSSTSNSSPSSTNASFRKVIDDYEAFMNKYVDFMKKYKNSSDTMSMLSEYSSMMQDYAKFADSIKGYNQNNLSASDWAYYLEVTTRVTKKLAEI